MVIVVSMLAVFGTVSAFQAGVEVGAQEATPQGPMLAEGVSIVPLAVAPGTTLPPSPATVVLTRYEIAPGAAQPSDASDPALALIYLESGTATNRLGAPVVVTRGATGVV
jgi:hypothetical protein